MSRAAPRARQKFRRNRLHCQPLGLPPATVYCTRSPGWSRTWFASGCSHALTNLGSPLNALFVNPPTQRRSQRRALIYDIPVQAQPHHSTKLQVHRCHPIEDLGLELLQACALHHFLSESSCQGLRRQKEGKKRNGGGWWLVLVHRVHAMVHALWSVFAFRVLVHRALYVLVFFGSSLDRRRKSASSFPLSRRVFVDVSSSFTLQLSFQLRHQTSFALNIEDTQRRHCNRLSPPVDHSLIWYG